MVRLCSESSRSYSGRPAVAARRQRRERRPAMAAERVQESAEAVVPRATSREHTGGTHNSGRAELGRQNTTIGGLVPGAMKPTGRALGSDHRGRERVAALSVRTARNRRTRTRMSGGVGGGGSNPPADPIQAIAHCSRRSFTMLRISFVFSSCGRSFLGSAGFLGQPPSKLTAPR